MAPVMTAQSEDFSTHLKRAREARGLGVRALGRICPYDHAAISRFESGERRPPERDGVIAIAKALQADVNEFLLSAGYAPLTSSPLGLPQDLLELTEPPDEEELVIVRMIGADKEGPFALLPGVKFWNEPRATRLRRLRFEADEWRDRKKAADSAVGVPQDFQDRLNSKVKRQAENMAEGREQREINAGTARYVVPPIAAGQGNRLFDPDRIEHDELDQEHGDQDGQDGGFSE